MWILALMVILGAGVSLIQSVLMGGLVKQNINNGIKLLMIFAKLGLWCALLYGAYLISVKAIISTIVGASLFSVAYAFWFNKKNHKGE